ncbi:universal stress protein [Actinoallomurus sp. NBC_01490]|uniref:universal stress protein n=1 Tax=Actinoallomurus sp. NBC_01490 TaxID=2903557 RepID=UPI002E32E5F7|nr:universal stress protein [Actinoallomurus sp. NBC_01490]
MKPSDRPSASAAVVVAGTDGSDCGMSAVEWAADEAARRDHTLYLIHTIPWLYGTPIDPESGVVPDEVIARGRSVLETAASAARERAPGLHVVSELKTGSPARVLLERARTAALVVVGSHGTGLAARLAIGSTALQVVAHAPVPAVVVREAQHVPWHEVTVGIDGGQTERQAVRFAFEEAAARKARLRALHAWPHPGSEGPGDMQPLVYDPALISDEKSRALGEFLMPWRAEFPDVEVCWEAVHGRAVRILAGASARCDLLVVGSRGRGGFPGLQLGSVSHAVLYSTHCPVAVVRSLSPQEES